MLFLEEVVMDFENFNIENIPPEVIVLIVGILVATLVILGLIHGNSVRRKNLSQDLETLRSAKEKGVDLGDFESLNIKRESPLLVNIAFVVQYIVGIGALFGFSWWTYYLIQKGLAGWGISTAIFALIGLFLPFIARSEIKRRKKDKEQLALAMENFGNASVSQVSTSATESVTPMAGHQKPAQITRWQNSDDMMLHYTGMDKEGIIPQDSTLKRHFLSTILAETESVLGLRPTDSTLQRHYDAMQDVEVESRLLLANYKEDQPSSMEAPVAIVPEVQAPPVVKAKADAEEEETEKEWIPEDSMLRRHYLSNLNRG